MKLRVRREDFIVKEVAQPHLTQSGAYGIYVLEKAGWNTTDALKVAARLSNVPYSAFSYGGRKDRHAITRQTVSIRCERDLSMAVENFSLELIGRSHRPMGPGMITANKFVLTLRALSKAEVALLCARKEDVARHGFSNFFDDQRFGSADKKHGFVAERILKGQHKGALELYLTARSAGENVDRRETKECFRRHWGDWAACLDHRLPAVERRIAEYLLHQPRGFTGALQLVPRETLSLHFSAYQSFLWNQMLEKALVAPNVAFGEYPGKWGPYVFCAPSEQACSFDPSTLCIPTPGSRPTFSDDRIRDIYDSVLHTHGLHRGSFNLRKIRQAYFKSALRAAIVVPTEFVCGEFEPDDLYPGLAKVRLRFALPRGSYATMCLKALLTDV